MSAIPFIRGLPETRSFVGRTAGFVPAQTLGLLGVGVATAVILHRTPWGDNREAPRMMDIPVWRSRIVVFASFEMPNWCPTPGEGYLLLVFSSISLLYLWHERREKDMTQTFT